MRFARGYNKQTRARTQSGWFHTRPKPIMKVHDASLYQSMGDADENMDIFRNVNKICIHFRDVFLADNPSVQNRTLSASEAQNLFAVVNLRNAA